MSYNGVGLPSARGSGTLGHVLKNIGAAGASTAGFYESRKAQNQKLGESTRKSDEQLEEHERKRMIEVRCAELTDQLEDEGVSEADIAREVQEFRVQLSKEQAFAYRAYESRYGEGSARKRD